MNATAKLPDNILPMLYDRQDGFVSVNELARAANLDAAGLSAAVKELEGRGFRFEQSPAHGLRLIRPTPLDAHLIERDLGTKRVGRHAIVFAEVNSTNDVAADSARQEGADGLVVLAESQRRGRGRLGRHWISPPGMNILMSVLLVEPTEKLGHEPLTIAAGLAAAEGIEQVCSGVRCELRWPNDVLIGGAKLAGVLLEMHRANGGRAVVIGIGINVNSSPPADQTDTPATNLADHVGGQVDRIEVVRAVLGRLDVWVDQVFAGRLDGLHDEWLARCGMLNQRVTVREGEQSYVGRVLDVSPLEGLILLGDDGHRVHLSAQSASLIH